MHPMFAQFFYEKYKPELEYHSALIEACRENLKIPESGSLLECQKYIPFAENMIEKLGMGNDLGQVNFISAVAYLSSCIAEYKKAEAMYKMSLEIREKVLGEEHLDTATSYHRLAYVYANQGEYKKAEGLYEKSLRIMEQMPGKEHSDTAVSYNDLAVSYFNQRRYGLALSYYVKAYKIFINKLGFKHPNTKICRDNMETTYAEWNPEGDFGQWLEEQMKEPEQN